VFSSWAYTNGTCNVGGHTQLVRSRVNSTSCTGVGETEWAFKTSFEVSKEEHSAANVDLVFEGLDTFATVKLVCTFRSRPLACARLIRPLKNGKEILTANNQFLSWRTAVKEHVKHGSNELVITFANAMAKVGSRHV
jgi:beta-mannosidase